MHIPTLITLTTIVSEKNPLFYLFPIQKPCRKIDQCQPSVIIWTNLVVLEHPMLHTKIQSYQSFGSGEEAFFKFFTMYENGGQLGHMIKTIWTNFRSKEAPHNIWIKSAQWFQRRCLKMLTYTYIHTRIPTYGPQRLTFTLWIQWEALWYTKMRAYHKHWQPE